MTMDEVRYLDIADFRREGYLQEVNRRFLHPLGLALEVVVDEDGSERLGRVWDYRDDAEGISYDTSLDLKAKAERIDDLWQARAMKRYEALGYVIQPVWLPKGRA